MALGTRRSYVPVIFAPHQPPQPGPIAAGKEVYVDVQGWHLYLKDVTVEKDLKMNQVPTRPFSMVAQCNMQRSRSTLSCSDVSMKTRCSAQALAEQLGSMAGDLSEQELEQLLKKVPLSLGAGKHKISLFDALPSFAVRDLAGIVQDFAKDQ